MRYCIDTSALMDGWHRWYPPIVFQSLWRRVEDLIDTGTLGSSEEVFREIEKKADDLHDWAKQRRQMFLPLDNAIQAKTSEIMAQFPRLIDERTGKSFADPFVIATAEVTGAILVTGEQPTRSAVRRPKIPDVCDHRGITWFSLVHMIVNEKWTF